MKKMLPPLCLTPLVCALCWGNAHARLAADSLTHATPEKHQLSSSGHWTLGARFLSPLLFDDLSSLPAGGKALFGYGGGINVGYQFSPLFALDLQLSYGQGRLQAGLYQQNFYLGRADAFTYYPYTFIDGADYFYPYRTNDDELLLGYRGRRLDSEAEAFSFRHLESQVQRYAASLHTSLNLTRLFYVQRYSEKPVELWVRPGVYLSHYRAKLIDQQTKQEVAPAIRQDLTFGLGGELALRFNLHPHWALELGNTLAWQHNRSLDGIASAKMSYDAFVWEPSLGFIYKFGRRSTPTPPPAPLPAPQPEPVAPAPKRPSSLLLEYDYPREVTLPTKKERSHTLAIRLTYPVNKTMIVPTLHRNAQELHRIDSELAEIKKHPDLQVLGIRVEGFASPEGPYDGNIRLAEGRARAIIDYVAGKTGWSRALFSLGRMEENWQGLQDTLQKDLSLPLRAEALQLLSSQPDKETVKHQLTQLKGYTDLLHSVYPYLRLSSYTVDYELPVYPLPRAKELLYSDPKSLSPEEIYAVALDYGLTSGEGLKALSILHQLYPESELSRCYRAAQALESDQPSLVLSLLEKRPVVSSLEKKLLATAYARLGRFEEAAQELNRIEAPDAMTLRNLRLLNKYLHD